MRRGFFDRFQNTISSTPFYSAIGNHDLYAKDPVYFKIFTFPTNGKAGGRASGTESYYTFNYSNIHFVCLDSENSSRASGDAMHEWLRQDLEENNQKWTVVFFHHSPYSMGSHNSDIPDRPGGDMRENFTPLFDEFDVDFVFTGHSHSYERFVPHSGAPGALPIHLRKQ